MRNGVEECLAVKFVHIAVTARGIRFLKQFPVVKEWFSFAEIAIIAGKNVICQKEYPQNGVYIGLDFL